MVIWQMNMPGRLEGVSWMAEWLESGLKRSRLTEKYGRRSLKKVSRIVLKVRVVKNRPHESVPTPQAIMWFLCTCIKNNGT